MIFKDTWQQVLDGTITEVRKRVRKGEYLDVGNYGQPAVRTRLGWRWEVGCEYVVQPNKGGPGIWISPAGERLDNALGEYVRITKDTQATWGPKVKRWLRQNGYWESRIYITNIRREHEPEMWVLEFELVGRK